MPTKMAVSHPWHLIQEGNYVSQSKHIWQGDSRKMSAHKVWRRSLLCGARLSQQWPGICLSYTLKVVHSTLLGLLINVLAPLLASVELPQAPIYGWSHSADMHILITCANVSGVSPCQTCLFWACVKISQACLLSRCVCSDHTDRYVSLPHVFTLT